MSTGMIFLIIFIVILINAVISFAISHRFYKLSRKDSHLQNEIRALRRDIDEKFTGNIKAVKEPSLTVVNENKNYSKDGGFVHKEEPVTDDIEEIAKKWNIEIERDEEPKISERPTQRKIHTKKQSAGEKPKTSVAKSKAKEILGDIFPFDE
ncbi:MAG: hypothetical protein IJT23_07250 [Clostridia bacterium]|nr:hypothetical protein [Clostridia bacterium]